MTILPHVPPIIYFGIQSYVQKYHPVSFYQFYPDTTILGSGVSHLVVTIFNATNKFQPFSDPLKKTIFKAGCIVTLNFLYSSSLKKLNSLSLSHSLLFSYKAAFMNSVIQIGTVGLECIFKNPNVLPPTPSINESPTKREVYLHRTPLKEIQSLHLKGQLQQEIARFLSTNWADQSTDDFNYTVNKIRERFKETYKNDVFFLGVLYDKGILKLQKDENIACIWSKTQKELDTIQSSQLLKEIADRPQIAARLQKASYDNIPIEEVFAMFTFACKTMDYVIERIIVDSEENSEPPAPQTPPRSPQRSHEDTFQLLVPALCSPFRRHPSTIDDSEENKKRGLRPNFLAEITKNDISSHEETPPCFLNSTNYSLEGKRTTSLEAAATGPLTPSAAEVDAWPGCLYSELQLNDIDSIHQKIVNLILPKEQRVALIKHMLQEEATLMNKYICYYNSEVNG